MLSLAIRIKTEFDCDLTIYADDIGWLTIRILAFLVRDSIVLLQFFLLAELASLPRRLILELSILVLWERIGDLYHFVEVR